MEKKQFNSDKMYSTYWWIIKLDLNHPKNYSAKVTEITGYSKASGHDEARNKTELLMKKIIMLYSQAYFEKGKFITIYMRQGELLNKANSRVLITMTKNDYLIDASCISDKVFYHEFFIKGGIINFLSRFYDCIAKGEDVKYLLPKAKATFSKDDYLDVTKQNFRTKAHLYAYCEKMIKNGHPFDSVSNFQRKYEERYFNL